MFHRILIIGFLIFSGYAFPQLISFPGAEGNGKFTSGGRGGRVIEVTNLNDVGPGSLRDAVKQDGARIVVFRISGTISLKSELKINDGDLTIAGQTAPGDGICLKNYTTVIHAENVIVRFLRFRMGDEKKNVDDALTVMNSKNIIIDHCSTSWGIDEVFSCYDNENSTVQWCIISEALNNSFHFKGEHGYGGIWGGKNATFHHNLFAHNSSRNPRFNGSRTKYSTDEEMVDFRNNVIYNWGINSSYAGEGGSYNLVGNYYKAGPASKKHTEGRILDPWIGDDKGKWFIDSNFVFGFPEETKDNWNGGIQGDESGNPELKSLKPFETVYIQTETAEDAFNHVLQYAGADLKRDSIDSRITAEVKNGTVHSGDGIIDSQTQVGGWPVLQSLEPPMDSDHDGMPDEWENEHSLNPADRSDGNKTAESGYTFIEEYINGLVQMPGLSHNSGCPCGNKKRKL